VLWTSEDEMRAASKSRSSETARKAALREQLTALKHRVPDKTITLSAKGKPLTSAQLQELWLSVRQKHGPFERLNAAVPRAMDTDSPADSGAGAAAAADASPAGASASASAAPAVPAAPQPQPMDQVSTGAKVCCPRLARSAPHYRFLRLVIQGKRKRGRSASARSDKGQSDNGKGQHDKNEGETKRTAAKGQRQTAAGSRARRAAPSADDPKRTLVCCSRPDGMNEPCVQCDVCCEWMHCMCENVDWDVVQEMGGYVCVDCERDGTAWT
jgi:hypothetical protein